MDHLTRVHEGSNLKRKYPVKSYKDNVKAQSIIECIINGEWDVSKERNMTYTLRNHNYIELVEEFIISIVIFTIHCLFLQYNSLFITRLIEFYSYYIAWNREEVDSVFHRGGGGGVTRVVS